MNYLMLVFPEHRYRILIIACNRNTRAFTFWRSTKPTSIVQGVGVGGNGSYQRQAMSYNKATSRVSDRDSTPK